MPILEDLADDPDFTGRLLVDVTPSMFFSGGDSVRASAVARYRTSKARRSAAATGCRCTLLEP